MAVFPSDFNQIVHILDHVIVHLVQHFLAEHFYHRVELNCPPTLLLEYLLGGLYFLFVCGDDVFEQFLALDEVVQNGEH